jgi:hypothetical protein
MKTNPVTPIEYQRMLRLKECHEAGEELRRLDVDLLLELLIRLYDEVEKG